MEAPLHQSPVPLPPPPPQDAAAPALLHHQATAAARAMAVAMATGRREQCPRCASRDTKFCYYNNYNTAQPRHFCRACRRYWTLGGSLRNVPVGGSTRNRKRPRPHHSTRPAIAAASSSSSAAAAPSPLQAGGLLGSLLLLGAASASPLLALGAAPRLEGRPGPGPGPDLGPLGQPAAPLLAGAADLAPPQLGFSAGLPPPWPPATTATVLLEGEHPAAAWKYGGALPPGAALWQELSAAAAAPPVEAGGLMRHGASPHLLL